MFDTVEYLKNTRHQSSDETVNQIAKFCEERGVDIPNLLRILVKYSRQRCTFNWIDSAENGECQDIRGEEVAYGLDEIAEAYGYDRDHLKCREVNERGCCAKINNILYDLFYGLIEEYDQNETGR